MLRFILILGLLCFTNPNTDEVMSWSASQKLTWADFQGEAPQSTDAAALTASGITFSYSVKTTNGEITSVTPKVASHFYPKQSWVVKDKASPYILAHEQLHFDITELHVRKLRYRIDQLRITLNVKSDLDSLHEDVKREMSDMQNAYDSQSKNSRNKEEQAKWNSYVAEQLKKYEAYKSN